MTEKTEQGDYKEELRKKFEEAKFFGKYDFEWTIDSQNKIFDFFYSEILSKDNANTILEGALKYQRERNTHLEELLKAADEVVEGLTDVTTYVSVKNNSAVYMSSGEKIKEFKQALEAYNKLKSTQKH